MFQSLETGAERDSERVGAGHVGIRGARIRSMLLDEFDSRFEFISLYSAVDKNVIDTQMTQAVKALINTPLKILVKPFYPLQFPTRNIQTQPFLLLTLREATVVSAGSIRVMF